MDTILNGLRGVSGILDDLIVTGPDDAKHLQNLEEVFQKFHTPGVKLKRSKCVLTKPSVEYFGFVVDKSGLHPSPRKVQAILEIPVPLNTTELKSFLELVNYYQKFIPGMSTLVAPLNALLGRDTPFSWTNSCQECVSRHLKKYCGNRLR